LRFRERTALPLAAIAPRPRRLDLPAVVRWPLIAGAER
jgi:hypothetical protein